MYTLPMRITLNLGMNQIGFTFIFLTSIVASMLIPMPANAQSTTSQTEIIPGQFFGMKVTTHPDWFKESFLEFEEDIAEATEAGKRLVIYFHQNGCPYCNKLVEDNFNNPDILSKMQSGFDLVTINLWGDREVVQVGGKKFTEKTLAQAMDVNFTPTLIFFNEDKEVALRLNGYYPVVEFDHALDYVSGKMEKQISFPEYVADYKKDKQIGELNQQKWILPAPYDLAKLTVAKPLAVLFEEPDCLNCDLLHTRTFTNPDAENLLKSFHIVQLNRWSNTPVIKPDGESTTAAAWARDLGLGFSPAIVLFDNNGSKLIVVESMLKTFHILGIFDYISSGAYQSEPDLQRYLSERAEHIISTGKDVNIWAY
jgi:thioredoxin-related protein